MDYVKVLDFGLGALGCVAYWLLTGKFVFQAPNPTAMLLRHLQQQPERASASSPHPIPPELDELILECLAKEPSSRPENAVELGRRLRACVGADEWTDEMADAWWAENMNAPQTSDTGSAASPARTDSTLSVSTAFLDENRPAVLEGTTN